MTSDSFQPVAMADKTAVIASGQTTSGAIDLVGTALVGLFMPSAFTGTAVTFTAAATLTGTYLAVTDSTGAAVSATVAASKYVALSPTTFAGLRYVKLVSGSSEGADRTITLATRPV